MPRPLKTKPNALRRLRIVTGLSQQEFADLVGLSVETIKTGENPRRAGKELSTASARRIAPATGASAASIIGDGPLLSHSGAPYTSSVWEAWKSATSFSTEAVRREAQLMGRRIEALICAADTEQRFLPTLAVIQELLNEVLKTRKAKIAYAQCLAGATARKRILRYTVGDLRREPAAARAIGFINSPRWCDVARVEVTLTEHVKECRRPQRIECEEEAIHYAFDWYEKVAIFEGTVDGNRPWRHEMREVAYLHVPVTQQSKRSSVRAPR